MEPIFLALMSAVVFFVVTSLSNKHGISPRIFQLLFLEHLAITLYYFSSVKGDWLRYYQDGHNLAALNSDFDYLNYGTKFILSISHAIQTVGDFSSLGVFTLFSLCGYLGLCFLLAAIHPWLTKRTERVWIMLLFLPGQHLWTCAIGKDSLIFLAIAYLLYSISYRKYFSVYVLTAFSLMTAIRPHVALMFIASTGFAGVLCKSRGGIPLKLAYGVAVFAVLAFLLPEVQKYVGVQERTFEYASARIEYAATKNQKGDGAVDITKYSPAARMFTYMFRPLFFDVRNSLGWPASIENAILLIVCCSIFRPQFASFVFSGLHFEVLLSLMFVCMMWFILGMSTANLGLALRQKTQFLPFIFFIAIQFQFWKEYGTVAIQQRFGE